MADRGTRTTTRTRPPEVEPAPAPGSPPAVRPTVSRWRDPRLAAGIALVALCAVLGSRALAAADDTVGVWAVRSEMAAGQRIGPGDVVRRELRFGDQADADRYVAAGAGLPARATLARAVGAGELLPRAALGGAAEGPLTEVPLSVAADAVPATVHVGSVVDVWVTPDADARDAGARSGSRSTLVLDDVPVVAAPRAADTLGPAATRQVIVGVDAVQGGRLSTSIAALSSGDVLLTVRR